MTSHHMKQGQNNQSHFSVTDNSNVTRGVERKFSILSCNQNTIIQKPVLIKNHRFKFVLRNGPKLGNYAI